MRADDNVRIQHMIDAANDLKTFVSGRERADFDNDRMLLFAVVRAIEIIGEAASRLSEETRALAPTIPWKAIVGMRNRIIHAYFDIDRDMVWTAAAEDGSRVTAIRLGARRNAGLASACPRRRGSGATSERARALRDPRSYDLRACGKEAPEKIVKGAAGDPRSGAARGARRVSASG